MTDNPGDQSENIEKSEFCHAGAQAYTAMAGMGRVKQQFETRSELFSGWVHALWERLPPDVTGGEAYSRQSSAERLGSYLRLPRALIEAAAMARYSAPPSLHASIIELSLSAEAFLSSGHEQRRLGQVFTPLPLARFMADRLLPCVDPVRAILDPACGSGTLLLAVLERLGPDTVPLLYGMDKSESAVRCTDLLIRTFLYEKWPARYNELIPELRAHFVCGDALLAPITGEAARHPGEQPWAKVFPGVLQCGGFSHVIGNPPYGLSRGEQLTPRENELLKRGYAWARTGKVNKYLLFLARGYELLHSKGRLVMVVPNSWLGIDAGRNLREHLVREKAIRAVHSFQEPLFSDRGVEAVVVEVTRGGSSPGLVITSARQPGGPVEKEVTIPFERLVTSKDCRISLKATERSEELLALLSSLSTPLAAPETGLIAQIALQAYAAGKGTPPQLPEAAAHKIFHASHPDIPGAIRYLEGRDVSRFSISARERYLSYGPWLAEYPPRSRFQGPRVLVREILGPPGRTFIAAYTEDEYCYNRSILHITAASPERKTLLCALTAYLHSTVASFWLSQRGKKSQRRMFPKIVVSDLKELPIPRRLISHPEPFAILASSAHAEARKGGSVTASTLAKIDEEVCRLFSFDPGEIMKLAI